MIILDKALQARAEAGAPVRVGLIGAGFIGKTIAKQITKSTPGMELVAIANRTEEHAREAFARAARHDVVSVRSASELAACVDRDRCAIMEDPSVLCEAENVDAVIEATGTIEFAARATMSAIAHGKHVILVNAELDGTLGPILKVYADRAGVVLTNCDGDQPGAEMNLYRFIRAIGMTPLLCGSVKGLMDHYRNPETQADFSRRSGQAPYMAASFADGTKISYEQAVVANATGMRVARRGMVGYEHDGYLDEQEHVDLYDLDELRTLGGVVDYVLGAKPGAGVYVLATHEDPDEHHFLDLYKLGTGPLYCFYTPHHLCYFEVPLSVGRAVLFRDAAIAPLAAPVVEVVATAKRDLRAGETIDGIGHFMTYGQCENHDAARAENLLPMGLAEGCRVTHDVRKDQVLAYADVELPDGRMSDALWSEQEEYFSRNTQPAGLAEPAATHADL
jgi:predicted homoserine dehydrogenase-like protein